MYRGHRICGGAGTVHCRRMHGGQNRAARRADDGEFTPLAPGPNDARIAYQIAEFLEHLQYSLQPLDKAMSEKFFDGYLESLDPRREYFLQSDIDEFAHYRTNLDKLTVGGNGRADLTPAYEIFERFLERLQQHTAYVNQLLKQDRLTFNTDERIATRPPPRAVSEGPGRGGEIMAPAVALRVFAGKTGTGIFADQRRHDFAAAQNRQHGHHHPTGAALQLDPAHGHQLGQRQCVANLSQRAHPRLRPAHGLSQRAARGGFSHQHEPAAGRHRRAIGRGLRLLHH